jgi:hypothetical protein
MAHGNLFPVVAVKRKKGKKKDFKVKEQVLDV